MGKWRPAPLPTQFHGVTIGAEPIRYGDGSGPFVGTRAMARDTSTAHDAVTARGIFGNALLGLFTTAEIGWLFNEPVPETDSKVSHAVITRLCREWTRATQAESTHADR